MPTSRNAKKRKTAATKAPVISSNPCIKVIQDNNSFHVYVADVGKYPDSFIAGYVRTLEQTDSAKLQTDFELEVEERDTSVFPFVEKLYAQGGKVKLASNMDKNAVIEELKFWFTNTPITVVFKDQVVEMTYKQRETVSKIINANYTKILDIAKSGSSSFNINNCPVGKNNEFRNVFVGHYAAALLNLFPGDKFIISHFYGGVSITWTAEGNGILAKAVLAQQKAACKSIWKRILAAAEKGDSTIHITELEYTSNVAKAFPEYAKRKTATIPTLTRDPYPGKLLNVSWPHLKTA